MKKPSKALPKNKVQNKEFWVALTLIFFLSTVAIINFQEGDYLTGGIAVQNIAYLQPGKPYDFEVKGIDGIHSGSLEAKETIKGGNLVFKEDQTLPFDGLAYSKFKISSLGAEKLGSAKFTLKVDGSRLTFPAEDLRLYVNGNEISTVFTSSPTTVNAASFHYYTATTSQFQTGDYVIGKKNPPRTAAKTEKKKVFPDASIGKTVQPPAEPILEQPTPVLEQPAPVKLTFWEKVKRLFGFGRD